MLEDEKYITPQPEPSDPLRGKVLTSTSTHVDREVQVLRIKHQFYLMYFLLGLVGALNALPVAVSAINRVPDNVVASLSQATLLLTGAAGSAVSFLIGQNQNDKAEQKVYEKEKPESF